VFGNPSLLTVAEMKRHLDYYNVTGVSRIAHVCLFCIYPYPYTTAQPTRAVLVLPLLHSLLVVGWGHCRVVGCLSMLLVCSCPVLRRWGWRWSVRCMAGGWRWSLMVLKFALVVMLFCPYCTRLFLWQYHCSCFVPVVIGSVNVVVLLRIWSVAVISVSCLGV